MPIPFHFCTDDKKLAFVVWSCLTHTVKNALPLTQNNFSTQIPAKPIREQFGISIDARTLNALQNLCWEDNQGNQRRVFTAVTQSEGDDVAYGAFNADLLNIARQLSPEDLTKATEAKLEASGFRK